MTEVVARREHGDEGTRSDTYFYRRRLSSSDLLPAVGVGVGVGVLAFYIARILLQRTPLTRADDPRLAPVRRRSSSRRQAE